jgi:hypothetical protein
MPAGKKKAKSTQSSTQANRQNPWNDERNFQKSSFFPPPSMDNFWLPAFDAVDEFRFEEVHKYSYFCRPQVGVGRINVRALERRRAPGTWGGPEIDAGAIPSHYYDSARLTLRQSVYWLSHYHAGFKTTNSEDESMAAKTILSLAFYYLLAFRDLILATKNGQTGPDSNKWRWERFDRHLKREMHLGGCHDPTQPDVKNFNYPKDDPTKYGMDLVLLSCDYVLD